MMHIPHQQVLDNLPDGVTIQDLQFRIIYQNEAMKKAFGARLGEQCYAVYERRADICEGCGVRRAIRTGLPVTVLRTAYAADGSTSYWENACFPLFDADGRIMAGVEVCRNIGSRVTLEEEVKERNIQLGRLNTELATKARELAEALAERERAESGLRREIKQRAQVEAELRSSEERYRAQFESALDAIIIADAATGVILDCNSAALRLVKKTREELVGHSHAVLHPPEAVEGSFARTFRQHLQERTGEVLEGQVITKDGEKRDVAIMASFFEFQGRRVLQGFFRDITERKRADRERALLEARLLHARKLESVGRLAAGVAHEINTPTQYIGDNLRFLEDVFARAVDAQRCSESADSPRPGITTGEGGAADAQSAASLESLQNLQGDIPRAIAEAIEGVEHISTIVRSLKEFSQPHSDRPAPADLNRAIENTITVCRPEWSSVAEMRVDLDPNLPAVPCLLSDFNQVMLNLILNSTHALRGAAGDGRGTISISTRHAGPWAEIQVGDTGSGMPADVRERIFDPFFTTKEVGQGTGQGLAVAHAIITRGHGGTISCESEVGKGTTFRIRLPLDETASAAA